MAERGPDPAAVEAAVTAAAFVPLGWFAPDDGDDVPEPVPGRTAKAVLMVGNAGPAMFDRFAAERDPARDLIDDWCRNVLTPLAARFGARVLFPFETPHRPFLTWARRAGAGHVSPLGLNIHPVYGLWHAMRAAFAFAGPVKVSGEYNNVSPCETCAAQPCLRTCPVAAFTGSGYDVGACTDHILAPAGAECRDRGCLARRACPVGPQWRYSPRQAAFHMHAFIRARRAARRT